MLATLRRKPVGPVPLNSGSSLASGLVSLWLMNEFGGARISDVVRGRIGALQSTAAWRSTISGVPGVQFNGTSDSIICNTGLSGNLALSGAEPYTIAAICKSDSTSSGAHSVVESGDGTVGSCVQLRRTAGTWDFFHRQSGSYRQATFASGVKTDRTQMAVGTYDTGGNMKLYVDGLLRGTQTTSSTKQFHGNNVYIGAGVGTGYYDGTIEFVGIWNRSLIPDEVLQLYTDPYAMVYQPSRTPRLDVVSAARPWLYRSHTQTLGAGFVRAA